MPNTVFGETSGSDIPFEHGLQAPKHFMKHNSEAGHESLMNYTNFLSKLIGLTRFTSSSYLTEFINKICFITASLPILYIISGSMFQIFV